MHFLVAAFICSSCLILHVSSENKTSKPIECDIAKQIYRDAGFKDEDIYSTGKTDNLQVCGLGKTCCMPNAVQNLMNSSEKKRKGIANPLHHHLKDIFQVKRMKFKEMFQNMMVESQHSLDSLFKTSYKAYYTNNAYIFDDLYKSMVQYINGSELDLKVTLNTFFGNLNEKMYVMYKNYMVFDTKYKNCIKDNTHYIKPFGDHQQRIVFQTIRVFEASRIFLRGLKDAMEVSLKLLELPVHKECKLAFMKMTHCSICSGIKASTKPCQNYCLNIMKGCYAYITMIQPKWNTYIDSMVTLTDKLKGPFNMEVMVVPLGVKISSAIMAFNDRLSNNTKMVETVCGKKTSSSASVTNEKKSRRVRSADDAKKALDTLKVSSQQILTSAQTFKTTQEIIEKLKRSDSISSLEYPTYMSGGKSHTTEFEKLLIRIKKDLIGLRDCWFLLPQRLCTDENASENNTQCWNGNNMDGYDKQVVSGNVNDLFNNNPEMVLKDTKYSRDILPLSTKLKTTIMQIQRVAEGKGIASCEDCESSGSSSGDEATESGDKGETGSGDNTTPYPTGPRPTIEEGSGIGSGDGETTTTDTNNNVDNGGNTDNNNNNNNKIPVYPTRRSTRPPCSPNDPTCHLFDHNDMENSVENRILLKWPSNNYNTKDNASRNLKTNFLLISIAVVIAYLAL